MVFGEKRGVADSKTGRHFCLLNAHNWFYAYKTGVIGAKL
jgi:hypothetical protein